MAVTTVDTYEDALVASLAEYVGRLHAEAPPESIATRLLATSPVHDLLRFGFGDAKCRRSFATAITNHVIGTLTDPGIEP